MLIDHRKVHTDEPTVWESLNVTDLSSNPCCNNISSATNGMVITA